jgi:hypothetical protein
VKLAAHVPVQCITGIALPMMRALATLRGLVRLSSRIRKARINATMEMTTASTIDVITSGGYK